MAEKAPYVIAVGNQKGGVAKTTTVVSLGGGLVKHNQEVLLIDLDTQANLTLALGLDPAKMRGTISDVFFNSVSLVSVSRETSIPGLDLVPSNSSMELAERFLPIRKNHEIILRDALHNVTGMKVDNLYNDVESGSTINAMPQIMNPISSVSGYDFIIMDCPPYLGAVTQNALAAANMLIIPTLPEYFSAHALRSMIASVRQMRKQHNPDLSYRILITLMDRRNRIHRDVCESLITTFKENVFQTMIEIDTKIRESAVDGLPITHRKKQSRSALQYDSLAQELIQYVQPNHTNGN
jgi:chromosome partitioning protein